MGPLPPVELPKDAALTMIVDGLFASFDPQHPSLYGGSDERCDLRGGHAQVPRAVVEDEAHDVGEEV